MGAVPERGEVKWPPRPPVVTLHTRVLHLLFTHKIVDFPSKDLQGKQSFLKPACQSLCGLPVRDTSEGNSALKSCSKKTLGRGREEEKPHNLF